MVEREDDEYAAGVGDPETGWPNLTPRTLVDRVVEVVVAQAARGVILPGDRLVEVDLARKLGVSRVPVREALRRLESHGVVINEPYRGIRLRAVTNRRVVELIAARTALETTATRAAVAAGRHRGAWLAPLAATVETMRRKAARDDAYGLAAADTAFHRELCRLGGNEVIVDLWETLALQLTIIFGLATTDRPMAGIVREHEELLQVFSSGDVDRIAAVLHEHITVANRSVDYEAIVAERRRRREAATRPNA